MSQPFRFGFGGDDDIEEDSADNEDKRPEDTPQGNESQSPSNAPRLHNLDDMLSTLPSKFSYNIAHIPTANGFPLPLARRELFDIRAQLMVEDTTLDGTGAAGLSTDDIIPNIYEGGFKTWEGSVDLASYLHSHHSHGDKLADLFSKPCCVIEMGAGTALPTLSLFFFLLSSPPSPHRKDLVLADFNSSVLSLATLPNILLTYALCHNLIPPSASDLDVTPQLLSSFTTTLNNHNIHLSFLSGAWDPDFVSLASPPPTPNSQHNNGTNTLILASETIYSWSTGPVFTRTLVDLLRACEEGGGKGKAYVAAKKVYFGVGGGVELFLGEARKVGASVEVVWETGTGAEEGGGVSRCVVEVGVEGRGDR